jgi:hypothetical protein
LQAVNPRLSVDIGGMERRDLSLESRLRRL